MRPLREIAPGHFSITGSVRFGSKAVLRLNPLMSASDPKQTLARPLLDGGFPGVLTRCALAMQFHHCPSFEAVESRIGSLDHALRKFRKGR